MERELKIALDDSFDLLTQLERSVNVDEDEMRVCVGGALLDEILAALSSAEGQIANMKERLYQLQAEQQQFGL